MVKIVKTLVEKMPAVKLIGRRYTDKDRDENGMFSGWWGKWFEEGLFDKLKVCHGLERISDDYIGAIRCLGEGKGFEYWIGMLMAPDDAAPEGFDEVMIGGGDLFVGYIYGTETNGEIYGEQAVRLFYEELKKSGRKPIIGGWEFERYNCPRFTEPDENGNVILDYCTYLQD